MGGSLEGVQIVECGTGSGVAYCGSLLAELGARVQKFPVDRPVDFNSAAEIRYRAENLYLNGQKEIVRGAIGDTGFLQRVRDADIVLWGSDPSDGTVNQIRSEFESWKATNENLVMVAITPFGVDGELSRLRGGDINAQAMSGSVWIVGNPGEAPLSMHYSMGALQQGLAAAGAVVSALLERSGAGAFVDISETDVIASCIRVYSLVYRFFDIELTRDGYRASGSSGRYPHTMLPCKDGFISTIGRSATDWERLMEMMGNPEWSQNPRYQDFFKMATEYPEEIDELLTEWLMQYTRKELAELANKFRVTLVPVSTVDEVLENPQFEYRQFFRTERDGETEVRVPGHVAHWTRFK